MSESYPEPDPALSRDARHSTYDAYVEDEPSNPPAGGAVVQTLTVAAPPVPPTISSLSPTGCPLGPPADVLLTVTGTGFDGTSQIGFGRDPAGGPQFEPNTVVLNSTTATIYVTAGLFPNPDPAVPVVVGTPGGAVSNELTFAIGAPAGRKARAV